MEKLFPRCSCVPVLCPLIVYLMCNSFLATSLRILAKCTGPVFATSFAMSSEVLSIIYYGKYEKICIHFCLFLYYCIYLCTRYPKLIYNHISNYFFFLLVKMISSNDRNKTTLGETEMIEKLCWKCKNVAEM